MDSSWFAAGLQVTCVSAQHKLQHKYDMRPKFCLGKMGGPHWFFRRKTAAPIPKIPMRTARNTKTSECAPCSLLLRCKRAKTEPLRDRTGQSGCDVQIEIQNRYWK